MVDGFFVQKNVTAGGLVGVTGMLSAAYTYEDFIDGNFDASGTSTFTGHVTGNTLTIDFSTQDQVGDTCTGMGSLSGTR